MVGAGALWEAPKFSSPLFPDLVQRVQHRFAGNADQPAKGLIQLEDQDRGILRRFVTLLRDQYDGLATISCGVQKLNRANRGNQEWNVANSDPVWDSLGMKLTAVFEPAKEGGYTCFVEEVPAAISQGETLAEAKANLLDALKLVLECQRELAEKELSPNAVREPLEFAEA